MSIALDTDEVANEGLARASAAIAAAAPLAPADQLVDAWFVETFHNLALPLDLYIRFRDAKERLKADLRSPPTKEG